MKVFVVTMIGMALVSGLLAGCASQAGMSGKEEKKVHMGITKEPFGEIDGQKADLYTLTNANGLTMKVTNFGGTVTQLWVPDRHGKLADVVLGFDTLAEYPKSSPYFACLVGRYANRVAKGKFTLEGKQYTLPVNNGENCLHGGIKGFSWKVWDAQPIQRPDAVGLELTYVSKDMEEGFPGTLTTKVVYLLDNANQWKIEYTATTDKPTVLNLTQHAYFNLGGAGENDILNTVFTINADRFTPTNDQQIPTGELRSVKGTPFDFTQPMAVGARIRQDDPQLKVGLGYDHNFVINQKAPNGLTLAATAYDLKSGRQMEVFTTEPGVQLYCGNHLDGLVGKGKKVYRQYGGFCFETQHFPDSPNQPAFPTTTLRPGETFKSTTVYKFSTR